MQGQVNHLRLVNAKNIRQALGGYARHACCAVLWAVSKGDLGCCGFHFLAPHF
jgi:hypothetical protein